MVISDGFQSSLMPEIKMLEKFQQIHLHSWISSLSLGSPDWARYLSRFCRGSLERRNSDGLSRTTNSNAVRKGSVGEVWSPQLGTKIVGNQDFSRCFTGSGVPYHVNWEDQCELMSMSQSWELRRNSCGYLISDPWRVIILSAPWRPFKHFQTT